MMNKKEITIQDCIDMYYKKRQAVILENGQVTGFVKEDKPSENGESYGDVY